MRRKHLGMGQQGRLTERSVTASQEGGTTRQNRSLLEGISQVTRSRVGAYILHIAQHAELADCRLGFGHAERILLSGKF